MVVNRLVSGWTASAHRESSKEKKYRYSSVADNSLHAGNDADCGEEEEGADLEGLRCGRMRSQSTQRR